MNEIEKELRRLAEIMYRQVYGNGLEGWKPLDSLTGVLSQIENCYTVLRRQRDQFRFDSERSRFWNDNFESSPRKEGKYVVIVKDLIGQGQVDAQWIGGEWHLPESMFPEANLATITHWRSL